MNGWLTDQNYLSQLSQILTVFHLPNCQVGLHFRSPTDYCETVHNRPAISGSMWEDKLLTDFTTLEHLLLPVLTWRRGNYKDYQPELKFRDFLNTRWKESSCINQLEFSTFCKQLSMSLYLLHQKWLCVCEKTSYLLHQSKYLKIAKILLCICYKTIHTKISIFFSFLLKNSFIATWEINESMIKVFVSRK